MEEDDEYEDSSLFLRMLDASAERIFEACSKINAAESSAIAIAWDIPPVPQASTSPCRSRKRRKRSWTPDEPVQDQLFPKVNISWAASTPLKVFQSKESLTFANNNNNIWQHQRKRGSRNNNVIGSVGSSSVDDGFLAGAMLPLVAGNVGKCATEETGKSDDLLKRIDRLESLIPSYQKLLLSSIQTPTDQTDVGLLELRKNCNSISGNAKLEGIVNQSLCPLRDLSLERNSLNRKGQVPKARVKSLRRVSSTNESIGSHTSEIHLQGLRTRRQCQCCSNERISKHALRKAEQLMFQTRLPSVGSSSFRGHKRISSKARDSVSEETSWSSRGSVSGTSTHHRSGYSYPSSCSGSSYSSVSGENENEYEEEGRSSTERSSTDYETASYNSQDDQYSDTSCTGLGPSSEEEEDYRLENRKSVGTISKIGKKFGMIFHHHHHHHHHHHVGFLKRIGKMFHRRGKSDDDQRQKPEKSRKAVTKSVAKKKQDGGHFRALADRFIRHRKHSKKTEKAKDEIGRPKLGSVGHKSRRGRKKLCWWPKLGRDKVKVANKGKVKKFGRAMTIRAKRSQFAAAKMILK